MIAITASTHSSVAGVSSSILTWMYFVQLATVKILLDCLRAYRVKTKRLATLVWLKYGFPKRNSREMSQNEWDTCTRASFVPRLVNVFMRCLNTSRQGNRCWSPRELGSKRPAILLSLWFQGSSSSGSVAHLTILHFVGDWWLHDQAMFRGSDRSVRKM